MIAALFTGKTPTQLMKRIDAHKNEKIKLKEIINQAAAEREATINALKEETVHLYILRDSF